MVKITGGQRIDLLGVRKEQLPAIWEDLGMPSGHAYAKAVRTVKTCVGTDFCRFGLGDSIALGIELERGDGGPLHAAQGQVGGHRLPAQLRRGVRQGHRAGRGRGRLGDLRRRRGRRDRAQGRPARDASTRRRRPSAVALAFLQHYREHGEYLERTYAYHGARRARGGSRAVLDAERQAALLERFRIAKAACDPDPWRERHAPVHPKQFAELDTEPVDARRRWPHGAAMSALAATGTPGSLVGRVGDVPSSKGAASRSAADGSPSSACRTAGRRSTRDCPHRGGPLSDGIVAERCVTCPLHGRRFDLRTGAPLSGGDGVAVHEVREHRRDLYLRLTG